jgi:hypothetical protein
MSTSTTTHHRLPGSTAAAAIVSAVVLGGVAALGVALSNDGSTAPAAPTSECTTASCVGPQHPLLPGRHDFQLRNGDKFHPTTNGR